MSVQLRDGTELNVGDEVTTNFNYKCIDEVFTVLEINSGYECESGSLVVVHLKGDPERILKSTSGKGLDANWFKKVNQ